MPCKRRGDLEVNTGYNKYNQSVTAAPYQFDLFNPYRVKETWETYTEGKADGRTLDGGTGWADRWKFEDGTVDILLPGESPVGIHFGDPFNEYDDIKAPKSTPKINFINFVNWKLVSGAADLIGPGLIDIYPGNTLYVDLAGTPGLAKLQTRNTVELVAGKVYKLSITVAGNRRVNGVTGNIKASFEGRYEQTLSITALASKKKYESSFQVGVTDNLDIIIELQSNGTSQITDLNNGPVLFEVEVFDVTSGQQIFYDNFDADNLRTADTIIQQGAENNIIGFKGTGFADAWKIYSDTPRYGYDKWNYTTTTKV